MGFVTVINLTFFILISEIQDLVRHSSTWRGISFSTQGYPVYPCSCVDHFLLDEAS